VVEGGAHEAPPSPPFPGRGRGGDEALGGVRGSDLPRGEGHRAGSGAWGGGHGVWPNGLGPACHVWVAGWGGREGRGAVGAGEVLMGGAVGDGRGGSGACAGGRRRAGNPEIRAGDRRWGDWGRGGSLCSALEGGGGGWDTGGG